MSDKSQLNNPGTNLTNLLCCGVIKFFVHNFFITKRAFVNFFVRPLKFFYGSAKSLKTCFKSKDIPVEKNVDKFASSTFSID